MGNRAQQVNGRRKGQRMAYKIYKNADEWLLDYNALLERVGELPTPRQPLKREFVWVSDPLELQWEREDHGPDYPGKQYHVVFMMHRVQLFAKKCPIKKTEAASMLWEVGDAYSRLSAIFYLLRIGKPEKALGLLQMDEVEQVREQIAGARRAVRYAQKCKECLQDLQLAFDVAVWLLGKTYEGNKAEWFLQSLSNCVAEWLDGMGSLTECFSEIFDPDTNALRISAVSEMGTDAREFVLDMFWQECTARAARAMEWSDAIGREVEIEERARATVAEAEAKVADFKAEMYKALGDMDREEAERRTANKERKKASEARAVIKAMQEAKQATQEAKQATMAAAAKGEELVEMLKGMKGGARVRGRQRGQASSALRIKAFKAFEKELKAKPGLSKLVVAASVIEDFKERKEALGFDTKTLVNLFNGWAGMGRPETPEKYEAGIAAANEARRGPGRAGKKAVGRGRKKSGSD